MKKLFLYISFAILIFLIAYGIGFTIYSDREQEINSEELDVSTENVNTEDFINAESDSSTDEDKPAEVNDEESAGVLSNAAGANNTHEYYIVTVADDYVIIMSDENTVYDYTDIETELLPEDTVNNLIRGIYFYDIMQMYNYLESLSSWK